MNDESTNDPIELLRRDAQRAAAADDPLARRCFLATLEASEQPALRTLVLRGIESGRIELYFSATSPKWRHLQTNRRYELLVYWPTIECQYRIRGGFDEIPFTELAASWKQKSTAGKLLDLYYSQGQAQSSVMEGVDRFIRAFDAMRDNADNSAALEAPPTLAGVRLAPCRVERLDLNPAPTVYARHLFTRIDAGWRRDALVP